MRLAILAFAAVLGLPAAVAAPIPMQPADLYRLEQPLDPQLAPDAKTVAVLREFRDIAADRVMTELWLVDTASAERRLLIGADKKPRGPRWSPDGKTIAFLGEAGGKMQLIVVAPADGRARALTELKQPPQSYAWSPDGSKLAFVAPVEIQPAAFFALPEKPDGAKWANDAKVIRSYPYRTDPDGWLKPGETHLFVVDAAGGTPRQISTGPGDWGDRDEAPAWTADSAALIVSADTAPDAKRRANQSDLFRIPAAGGGAVQLTSDKGTEESPTISPDGTTLAYVGWRDTGASYQQQSIFVMPLAGGPARNLTAPLDRNSQQPRWRSDGRGLHFLYQDKGVNRVGFAPLAGKPSAVVPEVGNTRLLLPSTSGGTYSNARSAFAYPSIEPDKPSTLALWRNGRERVLWDMNAAWRAERAIGKLEEIWVKSSADGRSVHGWILYPPNFDPTKKYPLALDIHGGPHLDYGPLFSATHHLYAAAGYVVLFTNPRGSIGYGEDFANLINKCYPCQDHDDLMSSVDAVIAKGFIDTKRLYIGGGSGGGVLSAWAIGKTDRFAAASVKRPVINWTSTALTTDISPYMNRYWFDKYPWEEPEKYWVRSPLSLVGNVKTPTLIITGENDFRTPMSDSEQYFQALQMRGVDSALIRLQDANHGFGRPSQWLTAILGTVGWYDSHGAAPAK
jgi:dipeptidyl aminopeptidase/acylaminoacyl peptidase